MKVKSTQGGSLKEVAPGTARIINPAEDEATSAVEVAKADAKKNGGINTRPLNAYIAFRCE